MRCQIEDWKDSEENSTIASLYKVYEKLKGNKQILFEKCIGGVKIFTTAFGTRLSDNYTKTAWRESNLAKVILTMFFISGRFSLKISKFPKIA